MTPRPAVPFALRPAPRAPFRRAPRRAALLVLLLAPCSLLLLFGAAAPPAAPVIVKNYFQRVFTNDTEGWRDTDLRAAEARVSREEVVLTGATYTIYSGDAANRPVTVFTTPTATFLPGQKILRGDGPVRVVRDDLEVSGEQWAYDHTAQAITIEKNARTVIRATLPDLIK